MTSTAALALHYGLRLDAAPEFVQGYADGMRLDQRGQGVACGAGWIPRTKKCSPDKAKLTSKEAKAKTVEKSKARAKLKGEVKAAKGQKARVKEPSKPKSRFETLAANAKPTPGYIRVKDPKTGKVRKYYGEMVRDVSVDPGYRSNNAKYVFRRTGGKEIEVNRQQYENQFRRVKKEEYQAKVEEFSQKKKASNSNKDNQAQQGEPKTLDRAELQSALGWKAPGVGPKEWQEERIKEANTAYRTLTKPKSEVTPEEMSQVLKALEEGGYNPGYRHPIIERFNQYYDEVAYDPAKKKEVLGRYPDAKNSAEIFLEEVYKKEDIPLFNDREERLAEERKNRRRR